MSFNRILKNFAAVMTIIFAGQNLFAAPPHSWDKKPNSYFWRVYGTSPKLIRYLPPHDRGWKHTDVRKVKVPKSRPIPRVAFGKGGPAGLGMIDKVEIPLELLEESGYSRNAAEVRVGIPFPRYGLYSLKNMRIRRPDGYEIPAQFAELSRWPDGSLRFVLASFSANLKAREKAVWKLEAGTKITAAKKRSAVKVTETSEKFLIDTGSITTEISKTNFQLPVNVAVKGKKAGGFKNMTIVTADGRKLRPSGKPDRLVIEEEGSEHVTFLSEGKMLPAGKHGSYKYQVRMRFRRNSPIIKMEIGFINADLEYEYSDIKEVYCELESVHGSRNVSAGLGKRSIHGKSIRQMTWNKVANGRSNLNGTLESWFALNTNNKKERISVAIGDAAKLWPKGVSSDGKTFRIELLPPLPDKNFGKDFPHQVAYCFVGGNHRHKWGMKFVTPVLVDFSGSSLPILAAESDRQVVAVLPPAWYEKCGVFIGANATVPGVDAKINEMLKYNDLAAEADIESGYFNYGDWFGERSRNWGNNEYDTPYSYFCQMSVPATASSTVWLWQAQDIRRIRISSMPLSIPGSWAACPITASATTEPQTTPLLTGVPPGPISQRPPPITATPGSGACFQRSC
ncbi:MAG: hypothetical protein IKC65_01885 [Lentisphaeria bacterium]|nr:hypothetical protein [Lentisphaeria bacterium]